ncbi:RNA polymerase sigma factor [Pedobacter psychroterrae]|uniref:Glucagon / GIP / secretin / VIP family domain-containing protein n=1 Tax=Pedobacter psychroterrae TaxID=2530453 RepID=A0A4R0NUJ6_9SPHI|nr:sigma factor [Pedobacter psychroterrae]TCD03859.1 hypothetical protein EZ437_07895 [Pedobacter psychroterrae]
MAAYSSHNDHVLLDLVKKSDYAAFTELYTRHADALYGAAYNILRDRQGCKDVLQDIFIWFWQNREDLGR